MGIERGSIVTVVMQGNYGKPRPAVVVQNSVFSAHGSITLCPLTSHLIDAPLFRVSVTPTTENGLQLDSQIMVDKIITVPAEKVGEQLGFLSTKQILEMNQALALWIGLV
ncbi:MAG: type II toxin-antitoxin system PemK/MazF family toxin [bacterium]